MYARVTLLEIDTVRTDLSTAFDTFMSDVLPAVREQPGFEGVLVCSTPEGKGMLVSFWDTPDNAQASGDGFYGDIVEAHMTLFRSPPGREGYDVMYAELPGLEAATSRE